MTEEKIYNKKFDFKLWKKILTLLIPYKKLVFIILIVNISTAIIDSVFPILTMYAIDVFVGTRNLNNVIPFILIHLVLILVFCILIYLFVFLNGKLETKITYGLRKIGFEKLQNLSFSYYDKTPVGSIMSLVTSDVSRLGEVLSWALIDIAWSISLIGISIGNMFLLNPKLAKYLLLIFPVMIFVIFYFQGKILEGHRRSRKFNSKITASLNENIISAITTKTLVREEENFNEFKDLTNNMKNSSIRVSYFSSFYMPIVTLISTIGIAIIFVIGGKDIMENKLTIGVLSLFTTYAVSIFDPIKNLANIISELQSAQAAAERTFVLLETKSDVTDSEEILKIYGDNLNPKVENWEELKGNIEFKNVGFSYNDKEVVLENFNLKVSAGEKIALVGETGSGKSTIINLICRFYEPTSGEILIDGVDYRKRTQGWLHSNLGYVLQAPHLFSGTVMENIRYGKLDATDEEIYNVAKLVNAYNFIINLENGFDTEVGEGGGKLSAGQKQLISFARAIIGNPSIFILDEATSSIDTETEQVIQKSIENILKNQTSFIVAHRLSTIRFCDRILVIKDGKILEEGNHKKLLKQKGYYFNLYTNQFKTEEKNKLINKIVE